MAASQVGRLSVQVLAAAPPPASAAAATPTTQFYLFHNWVAESFLECAFSTDITGSKATVSEERRALLDRPMRTQTCLISGMDRDLSTRLLYQLMRAAQEPTLVPVYSSVAYLTSAVSGAVVPCDTRYRRFHVGIKVLLYDPVNDVTETGVISSISNTALTLTGSVSASFTTTSCQVFPLMDAEVIPNASLDALTDAHGVASIEFLELMGPTALPPISMWQPPNRPTVSGLAVLNTDPDWSEAVTVKVIQSGKIVSIGRGTYAITRGVRPKLGFEFTLTALDRQEAWDTIRFFDAVMGRLRPFWVINPQVLFTTTALVATTHVDVTKFVSASGDVAIDEFSDYVCIEETDGTIHIRGITSVSDTAGIYRIVFDTALAGTIAVADVKRVTSAHKCRFAVDYLREHWLTSEVCSLKFDVVEVLEEVSAVISGLADSAAASGFDGVGTKGGPYSWIVSSKNAYAASNVLASAGSPSGDGDEVEKIYDSREVTPVTGVPSSQRPYVFNTGLTGSALLHRIDDFTIGRGRLCSHFAAANTDDLNLRAIAGVDIQDTWFDNTDGITMFVVVTDLGTSMNFFVQTGVLEWSYTDCKLFDLLSTDVANHHVAYADQTVLSNAVSIFALKWDPGALTQVWRDGVSLGVATTPIVSFPTGGGTINMSGDDAKLFDFMLYKEALSTADLNTVGNLLASIFNTVWTTVV